MKRHLKAAAVLCAVVAASSLCAMQADALNPTLPGTAFIPDGEPHVFTYDYDGDGVAEERLYLYGSRDERVTDYCGYGHDVWSAPVDDLTQWTNHGEVIHVDDIIASGYGNVANQHFGAPDCVYNPETGKYYLYVFLGNGAAMGENSISWEEAKTKDSTLTDEVIAEFTKSGATGPKTFVAESDTPFGPFENPQPCWWPSFNGGSGTFDPSVLVTQEADGVHAYAYWGAGWDNWGGSGDVCAEIDPTDMRTIVDPETGEPDITKYQKTMPEGDTDLFEASSIKQVGENSFVFLCSPKSYMSSLKYYWATDPLGPFTVGDGTYVIRNNVNWNQGNCHGSIFELDGQWYVAYHRPTSNDFNRQQMIDAIDLTVDETTGKVTIQQGEMTSQGTETDGLNPFWRYNIATICWKTGGTLQGDLRDPQGLNPLTGITNGTQLGFKYFNFDKPPVSDSDEIKFRVNIQANSAGTIEVWANEKGSEGAGSGNSVKLGEVAFQPSSQYVDVEGILSNHAAMTGTKAIYLKINGGGGEVCKLREYEFVKNDAPTPNPRNAITITGAAADGILATPTAATVQECVLLRTQNSDDYTIVSDSVVVKGADSGAVIKTTRNADGTYSFLMPNEPVTVSAEVSLAEDYLKIQLNGQDVAFDADNNCTKMVTSLNQLGTVTAVYNETAAVCTIEQADVANNYTATIRHTVNGSTTEYRIQFQEVPAFASSDFVGMTAEQLKNLWNCENENGANWTMTDGGLQITTEKGSFGGANDIKNVFWQYAVGDWTAVTKLSFSKTPSENYQQGGIVIFNDFDNYVKIDYEPGCIAILTEVNGAGSVNKVNTGLDGDLYLRLTKSGNHYVPAYSFNGVDYMELAAFDANYDAPKFGVFATNDNTDASAVQVTFASVNVEMDEEEIPCSADASIRVRPEMEDGKAVFEVNLKNATNIAAVQLQFEAPAGAIIAAGENFTYLDPSLVTLADGTQQYMAVLCYLQDETFTSAEETTIATIQVPGGNATVKLTEVLIASYVGADKVPTFGDPVDVDPDEATFGGYDLNGDMVVDLLDVVAAQKYFGAKAGDADWTEAAKCDVVPNDQIDLQDLIAIVMHYTETDA